VAFLKVVKGGCPDQIVELVGDRMVMGRHPNCEIVLDNAAVSRHHAQILETHGSYYLEDLRSRNRTFLNDIAVQGRTELHDRDEIKVCDVVFRFYAKLPTNGDSSSSSSWLQNGIPQQRAVVEERDTDADENPPPDEQPDDSPDAEPDGDISSIISTIDAKSSSHLRLNVKPDVKLRAVLTIGRALAQTLQLDDVLERTLDELFKIFPQAEEGFVLLRNIETGKLTVRATKTRTGEEDDSVRVSRTIVEKAMNDREAILSHDALQDTRFEQSESLTKLQIRSMMCVPLIDVDGDALGVIQLDARDMREQFSQDDLDVLVSVASQIALAVDNARLHQKVLRQRELEQERQRNADEMDLAVQVQLDFLPKSPPEIPGYEFYDFYEAAMEVGGDYFDYIELPENRIAVPVGDVAGKGVPAALLMAKLSSSARFELLSKPTVSKALYELNAEIGSSGLGHRFITLSMAVIDPKTHEVTIANAGHPPAFLRHSDGTVEELGAEIAGTPLGVIPEQHFTTTSFTMQEGDIIVQYSDGITEAMNPQEELFGRKRLKNYLQRAQGTLKEMGHTLLEEVEAFCGESAQRDDICLVFIKRTAGRE